jgi:carbonic anhydrase/acetyltransferase-like protein (isoleucine patch superfamily)
MAIYELDGVSPTLGKDCYIADSAQVMGDVVVGEAASLWFGVIARGDSEKLTIGRGSNIQDGCVLHADAGKPLLIGDNVSVGHMVMLHGCSIGDGTLIGIGAIVLNDVKIGKNCIVGANSLVTEGKEFPDGSMIMGTPAKVVRQLAPEQIAGVGRIAGHYVANGQRFRAGLKKIG